MRGKKRERGIRTREEHRSLIIQVVEEERKGEKKAKSVE